MDRLNSYSPLMLGVLRLMAGLLVLAHGTQKFLSFPGGDYAGAGWAFANPGAYAGVVELVTGALIAIGLFTRPAAFLASGTMAAAYSSAMRRRASGRSTTAARRRSCSASCFCTWSLPVLGQ